MSSNCTEKMSCFPTVEETREISLCIYIYRGGAIPNFEAPNFSPPVTLEDSRRARVKAEISKVNM